MTYDIYLFDADNTLFDYDKAEEWALRKTFKTYNLFYSDEIKKRYRQINDIVWGLLAERKITMDELKIKRFDELFNQIEVACDTRSFSATYLANIGEGAQLIDGAYEVCKALHEHGKKIYIVTNGISFNQNLRLYKSVIKPFVPALFASEDVGFAKPDKRYFDYVFDRIEKAEKSKLLIIGDALATDIQGGINAGIDTCWFNPVKKENTTGINPKYEIAELTEVLLL